MVTAQRSVVVGVFNDRQQAQRAVEQLRSAGFREDQIGVVARGDHSGAAGTSKADGGTHWEEGAAVGAATGAGVGALWALGIAAGMLPAIGPIIAGGIFASILASAAGAGAVGGIVGALIGMGVPEEEAAYYENEFQAGRVLVTVKAENRYAEAYNLLRSNGAYDIENRQPAAAATSHAASASHATAAHAHAATGQESIRLHEEQLHAQKQQVQTGEVRVRKEVVTEHKTLEVPVTREEVVIERHPVAGHASSGSIRAGEEIRIPVKEEQVHVTKETVAKEEVTVGKRKVQDTEHVAGTVRKEEVRVESEGDVDVHHRDKDAKRRK